METAKNIVIGCGGAIIKDSKLLLTKRVSSKGKYPDCWTFPAGRLETTDKSVEERAITEVKEEVNLDFVPTEKLGFYETRLDGQVILSLIYLGTYSGEVKHQEEEVSETGWFTYEEAKELEMAFAYAETIEDLHKKELI